MKIKFSTLEELKMGQNVLLNSNFDTPIKRPEVDVFEVTPEMTDKLDEKNIKYVIIY